MLDLNKKQISYLIPLIEARIKVLKKRVLKKYMNDWYDYSDSQLDDLIKSKDDEFFRLTQTLDRLYDSN